MLVDLKPSASVGIFHRPAGGGDWQNVLPDLESYTVSVHPSHPDVVFAGTADGVWRSSDGGKSFQRTQFPENGPADLVIPSRCQQIQTGSMPEARRSLSIAAKIAAKPGPRLPTPQVPARAEAAFEPRVMRLAQHPNEAQRNFCSRRSQRCDAHDGRRRNLDRLQRSSGRVVRSNRIWRAKSSPIRSRKACLMVTPSPSVRLILTMSYVAVRMGLFRSSDQGSSWQDMEMCKVSPVTYGRDIRVSPQDPKTMYAALERCSGQQGRRRLSYAGPGRDLEALRQSAGPWHGHVGCACTIPTQTKSISGHAMTAKSSARLMAVKAGTRCECPGR